MNCPRCRSRMFRSRYDAAEWACLSCGAEVRIGEALEKPTDTPQGVRAPRTPGPRSFDRKRTCACGAEIAPWNKSGGCSLCTMHGGKDKVMEVSA